MNENMTKIEKFQDEKKQKGASLVEYALLVALISIVAIVAIKSIGSSVSAKFSSVASAVS